MNSKKIVINLLLLVLTFLVTLVCFDFGVKKIFNVPSNYLKQLVYFNSELSPAKRLRPLLNVRVRGDFNEFNFKVTTDESGFRITPDIESDVSPLLVLGDSQSFGIGVEDHQTYSAVLSRLENIKVINSGCPGYNNHEEALLLKSYLKAQKVSGVILGFFAGNDPYENFKNHSLFNQTMQPSSASLSRNRGMASVKDYLARNSSIYNLLSRLRKYDRINSLLKKWGVINPKIPAELEIFDIQSTVKQNYWNLTEKLILEMRDFARERRASFHIVLIPDRYQVDLDYWKQWVTKFQLQAGRYDLLAPNEHLKLFCEKNKIPFIDPTSSLKNAQRNGFKMYWDIDNHLSPDGHRSIALSIADFLKKNPTHISSEEILT